MFWVAATLWDTSILIYEAVVEPLSDLEKEQYYAETRVFCRLFGLPADLMPPDWPSFRRYFDEMVTSSTLHVGETARTLGQRVLRPPRRLAIPLYRFVDTLTAGLMPPALREAYGIPYARRHHLLFETTMKMARTGLPALPDSLRYCPAYLDARRRVRGEPGHNRLAESWKTIILNVLRGPRDGE